MSLFAHRMHVFVLALLLWVGLAAVAWAAPDVPTWRQHLSCDPTAQHYRGLEYCTDASGQVHVIVLDLHSPDVRLEYIIAKGVDRTCPLKGQCQPSECKDVNRSTKLLGGAGCDSPGNRDYYPVLPLGDAVALARERDPNTATVINSDYGAGTQDEPSSRDHGPEGFTVVHGDRLDGPRNGDYDAPGNNPDTSLAIRRPWLAISRDAPLRAELGQLTRDDGGKANWIYTGVGGGPWLIRGGDIRTEDIKTCKNCSSASCREGVDQTAVGLSQDRRWLFLVIDARKGKLLDVAQFMSEQLVAWDAIKFDGGGSSQLWYAGQFISHDNGRQLSQYLAVVAPPGSGIEDTVPPASLGDQLKGLVERLRQAIARQIEEWRRQIEQEAGRQLAELERQLSEWIHNELERQIQNLAEQLCGGSTLLPIGVAVWLAVRRRR